MRGRPVRGFTLIEVMVAMTIFGVGILGVVTSFAMGGRASAAAMREAGAARLAANQMVLAVQLPAADLQPSEGEDAPYRWRVAYPPLGGQGPALAEVTVEWQDRGEPKAFVLRELFVAVEGGP